MQKCYFGLVLMGSGGTELYSLTDRVMQETETTKTLATRSVDLLALADRLEVAALRDFEILRPFGLTARVLIQIAAMRDQLAELPLPTELEQLHEEDHLAVSLHSQSAQFEQSRALMCHRLSRKLKAVAVLGQMMWQEIDREKYNDYHTITTTLRQEAVL